MDEMKAVQLSFSKRKLIDLFRELFLEHGWTMPEGLRQSQTCDPRNFTLAEWQQAKRIGKDPKQIKAIFQECWSLGKTQKWVGIKTKEVRTRLTDEKNLPSVDEARSQIAKDMTASLRA